LTPDEVGVLGVADGDSVGEELLAWKLFSSRFLICLYGLVQRTSSFDFLLDLRRSDIPFRSHLLPLLERDRSGIIIAITTIDLTASQGRALQRTFDVASCFQLAIAARLKT
jgi:hypothetical protein